MKNILNSIKRRLPERFTRKIVISEAELVDTCVHNYLMSKKFIRNFRGAIDIGCRDGDFSRPLLNDFQNIYAFDFRKRLRFESSKLTYYQCALGDEKIKVRASGGVITDIRSSKLTYVQQNTLDSFKFKEIDLIKIDVEGHELKVLKGAKETLERWNPVLIIEENGSQVKYGKGQPRDAINYLISLGYKIVAHNKPPLSLDYVLTRE